MTTAPSTRPVLRAVTVADDPAAWAALGFTVRDGTCHVGGVDLHLEGRHGAGGLRGWWVETPTGVVGEVATLPVGRPPTTPPSAPPAHANGVTAVDHLVVHTDDVDATVAALDAAGVPERRRVEGLRGGSGTWSFALLTTCALEVVGPSDTPGTHLWGLALVAPDLDATVAALGSRCGPVRDAVQPGRRIATVHAPGVSVPLALLSPRPAL